MRDFSFTQSDDSEQQDIERILRQRRRKIYKQQLIYTIILSIIIAIICIWLYRKSVYVEFDGYVSVDSYTFRTDEDVYFLDSKWRVGDLVLPGDTVFSYVLANNFYKHESNDYEPTIVVRDRDLKVQYGMTRQDLNVLKVRIGELERQLSVEDHNIRLGLSNNHNKLRTEQELSEAREQYNSLRRKLGVLWNALTQSEQSVKRLTNNGYGYLRVSDMRNVELLESLGVVRHSIASDSSIVTEKLVPTFSLVLRGEPIMTAQGLNLADNNVSVVAYVKPEQMKFINYHTNAKVIVTDEISYTASVLMLGARTEEIPGELRSTLSRDHTASIVVFNIDEDQDIPFWSLINGLPVTLRINKFREGTSRIDDYIVFNTTYGIDPQSMMKWRHNKETIQEWNDVDTIDADTLINSNNNIDTPTINISKQQVSDQTPGQRHDKSKPAAESAPVKSESSKPIDNIKNAVNGSFHIIVGSGVERDKADYFADRLRKQGYKGARVIDTDGRYRISIASFTSSSAANAAVAELAKDPDYKSAWTLYQKID
ncbi:MAG: SPOR domain-containing protein [Muribaculaceae bacterium]|nr:SPOR domain-containing protein [Muribaculaceae bacterium]